MIEITSEASSPSASLRVVRTSPRLPPSAESRGGRGLSKPEPPLHRFSVPDSAEKRAGGAPGRWPVAARRAADYHRERSHQRPPCETSSMNRTSLLALT